MKKEIDSNKLLDIDTILSILNERVEDLSLKDLPDPLLFDDMEVAVDRVSKAVKNREKIMIVGDYDVDGICSVAIMKQFFAFLDLDVSWYIPNRFTDGYGLSKKLLMNLEKTDLIITVDNGINSHEAADYCKANSIDLIITDHHKVPDTLPEALAIINQKKTDCSFPYNEICGAQIAWYMCAALNRHMSLDIDMRTFMDLVAVAIVADLMPLTGINRAMLISGLKQINYNTKPYISAYLESKRMKEIFAEDIAFGLAPMINSAGRMDTAVHACNFICSSGIKEARKYILDLDNFNKMRKEIEKSITKEAIEKADSTKPVIIAADRDWHEGVLGIVASRLAGKFKRPAIVLSRKGDYYKGSGRSYGDCDLFELVNRHRDLTYRFGGHKNAIGLTLHSEQMENFTAALENDLYCRCTDTLCDHGDIIGELPVELIGLDIYYILEKYEPYGYMNPRPKFISRALEVVSSSLLRGGFKKYVLKKRDCLLHAVDFISQECFRIGQTVDIVYSVKKNDFMGKTTLQLILDDIKNSSAMN